MNTRGSLAMFAVCSFCFASVFSCGGGSKTKDKADAGDSITDVSDNPDIQGDTPQDGQDLASSEVSDTSQDQGEDLSDSQGDGKTDTEPQDLIPDTLQEELDRLFPGIKPECRPEDLGCKTDADCLPGEKCIAAGCVTAVTPADYQFSPDLRLVRSLYIPGNSGNGSFDFNGDGKPDNALADALAMFEGGAELVNKTLDEYFSSGQYTYLVEFRNVPSDGCGPLQVAVHSGTSDVDQDGLPDLEKGEAQVVYSSFREDGFGPTGQLNLAAVDGNLLLSAPGGKIEMPISLPDGSVLIVPIEGIRVKTNIQFGPDEEQEVPPDSFPLESEELPPQVNGEVGGYVRLQSIVDEINARSLVCACSGIDIEKPVAETAVENGAMVAKCVQQPDSTLCPLETYGQVCSNLSAACLGIQALSLFLDVKTGAVVDGSGKAIPDAISLGLYAELTPTVLAEPPLAPDFAAVNDLWEANPVCELLQDSAPKFIGVLLNDFYDKTVAPIIVSVTTPSAGGAVEIVAPGDRVKYTPAPGYYGFDDFTYSIQDAAGNQSSASVNLRISRLVEYDPEIGPETFCNLLCEQQRVCKPDEYAGSWGEDGGAICMESCFAKWLPLWDMTSWCAQAMKQEGLCQVILTCPQLEDFDEASLLAQALQPIPELTPCGGWILNKVKRCGTCEPGYYSPECKECPGGASLPCGGNASCVDGSGGDGSCVCDEGYEYDGMDCVDIDECALNPTPCGAGAVCKNRDGAYVCDCPKGQAFNGKSCVLYVNACNPNPCLLDPKSPSHTCILSPAEGIPFSCDCEDGYPWNPKALRCMSLTDQCDPNPCYFDPYSSGVCFDFGPEEGYMCECEPMMVNYWLWDKLKCGDPCEGNDCADDPYSTGACEPDSVIGTPKCLCIDDFYYDYMSESCVSMSDPCLPDRCHLFEHAVAGTCVPGDPWGFQCDCEDGWNWKLDWTVCEPAGN